MEQELNLTLTVSEVRMIGAALGNGAYNEVAGLIAKLDQQCREQMPGPQADLAPADVATNEPAPA